MFEIQFYCREAKVNKKGYATIQMSVCMGEGKRGFISLPLKEKPETFKKLTSQKKTNELKESLVVYEHAVQNIRTRLIEDGQPQTIENIKEYLFNGGKKKEEPKYTIDNLYTDFLKNQDLKVKSGQIKETMYYKHTLVQKDFYTYLKDYHNMDAKDTPVEKLSGIIMEGFYSYLGTIGKQSTTTGKMTKIKAVMKFGNLNYLFNNIIIRKPKPNNVSLTDQEYEVIKNKPLFCDRLNKVRDLFLFQANSGLAFIDMTMLKKEDIHVTEEGGEKVGFIKKERVKTGVEYTSVILPDGLKILEKYDWKLPVLSNQRLNSYLKEIQDICGIKKNLHSHLARKTYAKRLLNRGLRVEVLKECMGHTNSAITLSTYAEIETSTIVKEVMEVWKKGM